MSFIAIIAFVPLCTGFISNTHAGERLLVTGLEDARSISISTLGHLFVAESGRHRILMFTDSGERMDSVGRLGNGDYQFDTPVAIDPTNELKIYVADRNNRRIQIFDRRLQYLSTISLPERAARRLSYRPTLLTVDQSGRLYFFDDESHRVYRFDSSGQFDLSFELYSEEERIQPVSMDIRDNELWVIGERGLLLHRFSSGGSYLGFLYSPEPALSLRIVGDQLWLLGQNNLLRLDPGGEVSFSKSLPDVAADTRHRRVRRSETAVWRSFDIKDRTAYVLNSSRVLRMELEFSEEEQ